MSISQEDPQLFDAALGLLREELLGSSSPSIERKSTKQDALLARFDEQKIARVNTEFQRVHAGFRAILRGLRSARNQLCAVNILPLEVLGMVFQFLCAMIPGANIIVSAVCTYWRYAALGDPWLWRVINLAWDREKVHEFMQRSGTVPLELFIDDKTTLEACRDVATRATIVHMSHPGGLGSHKLDSTSPLNLHWPKVKTLVLRTPEPNTSSFQVSVEDAFPYLQRLEMSRSSFLPSCTLSNLRTLKITHHIPGPKDMLSLLRKCARLEVLELFIPTQFCSHRRAPTDQEVAYKRLLLGQRISIPTLRDVTLRLPVGMVIPLLSCIDIPSEIEHLEVIAYRSYRMRDKLLSAAKKLFSPQCLPTSTFEGLGELCLHTRHRPWTVTDNCVRFSHITYHRSLRRYEIEVGIEHPHDCDPDKEMKKMFTTVVQTLRYSHPMSALRRLKIDGTGQYAYILQNPSPGVLLGRASSLETLEIKFHRIRDLHRSLVENGLLELPSLRVLVLETACENEQEMVDYLIPLITRLSTTPVKILDLGLACRNIRSPERAKSLFMMLKDGCAPISEVYSAPGAVSFTACASATEFREYYPQDLWPKDEPFTWKVAGYPM